VRSTLAFGDIMIGMKMVAQDAVSPGAFSVFFNEHRLSATRLAWLLTHDSSSCEDIAQEAFAQIFARFDSLDEPAAYLRRVIINAVADRSRRAGRERFRIELVTAGQPMFSDGPTGGLLDAIAGLPLQQRTAVVLRYWCDLDHLAIADTMGIRPGTVRSLLSRATATLRKDITP
jgi:DNA-directed RNA polymerase specialized sigma24 family protein